MADAVVAPKPGPKPIPSALEDGQGFLIGHGWEPLGPPEDKETQWLDPTKPLVDEWTTIQKFTTDRNGDQVPIMAQHGRGKADLKPVFQPVCTPAGEPMKYHDALAMQKMRDMDARRKKLQEEQIAKHQAELKKQQGQPKKAS